MAASHIYCPQEDLHHRSDQLLLLSSSLFDDYTKEDDKDGDRVEDEDRDEEEDEDEKRKKIRR